MDINNPEEVLEELKKMPEEMRYAFAVSSMFRVCGDLDICPHCVANKLLEATEEIEKLQNQETKH